MIASPLLLAAAVAAAPSLAELEAAAYDAGLLVEVQSVAPAVLADAREGSEAYRRGDWAAAMAAYGRVAAGAPGWSHAVRRQCVAAGELGRRGEALGLCRRALTMAPLPENALALATTLAAGTPPTEAERAEARRLASGALQARSGDYSLAATACGVAMRIEYLPLLESCSRQLMKLAPEEPGPLVYRSIAAISAGRLDEARALLGRASAAGVEPALVADLSRAIEERRSPWARWGTPGLRILAVWAMGLLLLVVLGAVLSAATSASAGRLARSGASGGTGDATSRGLRRLYGAVLLASGAYYYVSIPLVLLAVLALGGGVLYAFMELGRIPVKLVLILGIVVIMTVFAVLKSIWVSVVRPPERDPGAKLEPGAHPALQALVEGVAAKIGTRPVDTVFLTPGTDMAVFERGSMLQQLRGTSERCLILGVGLLDGMKQGELKAILAHEYGHFVNRDTAGGGFALAVRRSLLEMGRSLAQGGAATWYNPAWWFVRGFYKVFLRISQGASRLQEILADRWAALAYGGQNFASGLRHVVARSLRFDDHAERTLKEVIEGERPLANLYRYAPTAAADPAGRPLDAAIEEALAATPSPYDSHPRPKDRIAWVAGIAAPRGEDDDRPAWELFSDREALEREMTDEIREAVAANHGVRIPTAPAPEPSPP